MPYFESAPELSSPRVSEGTRVSDGCPPRVGEGARVSDGCPPRVGEGARVSDGCPPRVSEGTRANEGSAPRVSASSPDPSSAAYFDWNRAEAAPPGRARPSGGAPSPGDGPAGSDAWLPFSSAARPVQVVDETLRDGIQAVSSVNPSIARKIELVHAMAGIGVDVVNVGLPAAGQRHFDDARLLLREIVSARLPLIPTAAARTTPADVEQVARTADGAGVPVTVYGFIGSSPIRQLVEGWDLAFVIRSIEGAARAAASACLPFCLVLEDATRSPPRALRALFRAAVDTGAARICLCDTTGHGTASAVAALIGFTRRELAALGAPHIELDWHAHNDRGLGLSTALWAAACGVERVHGTALGVGERAGNSCLELLVDNLGRLGARPAAPRERLVAYCAVASRALAWPIAPDHPIAGARFAAERGDPSYRAARAAAAQGG